jgi:hemerythrin-like metal-binding protein
MDNHQQQVHVAHHGHQHNQRSAKHVDKLEWNDSMLLGHGPMDDEHREFVECVMALKASDNVTALPALARMESHLVTHFELEHAWMEKTAFPEVYSKCHRDQHNEVLDSILQLKLQITYGQAGLRAVHALTQSLMDWFPGHADYMDSALSAWVNKKLHGGAPVVLRRDLQVETPVATL